MWNKIMQKKVVIKKQNFQEGLEKNELLFQEGLEKNVCRMVGVLRF